MRGNRRIVPLLSIWTRPRATIRRVADGNPRQFVISIGWITGALAALLFELQAPPTPATTGPVRLAMSAFTLGLAGVGIIYILAFVMRGFGRMMGGVADILDVRAALAWSWLPLVALEIVAVFVAIAAPATPDLWAPPATLATYEVPYSYVIEGVLAIWSLFLLVQTLSEVNRLSPRRTAGLLAMGTVALGVVALGGFIVVSALSMLMRTA